jgi:hypothetical protein
MMMKVNIMTTSRETLWYEYLYVKLYWFGCIAMICGQCRISGDETAQNRINDDKTPSNTVPLYIPL